MSASAPIGAHIEPEPLEWQPRATWATARLLCGSTAFFCAAFVFAYFYLRSLDSNRDWKIGRVDPSLGLGIAIVVVFLLSAVAIQVAARVPARTVLAGGGALALALLTIVLQVVEWTTLGFGPASGGYASVFVGWTGTSIVLTLIGAFWIETQVATAWRAIREGPGPAGPAVIRASLDACAFYWTFYVALALLAFVILYLV